MNHSVTNVQNLYDDARRLYDAYVVGSDASADKVLYNLGEAIENLKEYWKGVDAGVQINSLVSVYNSMVSVRNVLAELAVESTKIASYYREIQRSNSGNKLEALSELSFESKGTMGEYTDNADTISIVPEAAQGRVLVNDSKNVLESFKNGVEGLLEDILDNWTAGAGRDNAVSTFGQFKTDVASYQEILSKVSTSITTALENYQI